MDYSFHRLVAILQRAIKPRSVGEKPPLSVVSVDARPIESPATDPVGTARAAGLRHVSDARRGFTRKRRGKGFVYVDTRGNTLRDGAQLARLRALAIPPAWTDVWICPHADGHIQATGRDARGRKQYLYHPRWHETRNETKFEKMLIFGEALPRIRHRVQEDLRRRGLPREKVLAAIIRLLEITLVRVGNDEYAKNNESFGLTTMRDSHADVDGATMRFRFKGKSGIEHDVALRDRRLARIVKRCQELPGQELFQYVDENGEVHDVGSTDINDYLRAITQQDFTAKDFRTWAGTLCAVYALKEIGAGDSATANKKNIAQAVKRVAGRLGNTPTVCRQYYIHPAVLRAYGDGTLLSILPEEAPDDAATADGLPPREAVVMNFLRSALCAR